MSLTSKRDCVAHVACSLSRQDPVSRLIPAALRTSESFVPYGDSLGTTDSLLGISRESRQCREIPVNHDLFDLENGARGCHVGGSGRRRSCTSPRYESQKGALSVLLLEHGTLHNFVLLRGASIFKNSWRR